MIVDISPFYIFTNKTTNETISWTSLKIGDIQIVDLKKKLFLKIVGGFIYVGSELLNEVDFVPWYFCHFFAILATLLHFFKEIGYFVGL